MKLFAEGKTRYVYIEAVRTIAAFFVIFNHTGGNGFFLFAGRSESSLSFWAYLCASVFCKVSVPLFFAVSGALMLGREDESLTELWRKRIFRICVILCVFIFGNYLVDALCYGQPVDWKQMFTAIYSGRLFGRCFWYGHLWYLYAYIAYLICMPFLRSMVRNLDNKHFYYMIGIALFFSGVLPAVEYLTAQGAVSLNKYIKPGWLWESIVLYPCIGYFLENRMAIEKQKKNLLWLWLLNGIGIAVSCYMVYYQGQMNGGYDETDPQTFHSLFVLLNCVTVYLTVKYFFSRVRIPQWLERGILSVGKCTFGIYLLHIMVLKSGFMGRFLTFLTGHGVNNMLACLMQCTAVMAICCGVTYVLLKIPGVRKLAGG